MIQQSSASKKHRLGYLLVEAGLIVLGVMLGMMANEWRVSLAEQNDAQKALQSIRQELQNNFEQVEELLPYHQSMTDSMRVLMNRVLQQGSSVTSTELFRAMPRGFAVPIMGKTAWEMAVQTGVVKTINFDLANDLSRLYSAQAFYQDKLDIIGQNLYVAGNINPTDLSASTVAIGLLSNDIVIQEQRLAKQYPAMIARLNSLAKR